jgi:ABC-type polysaccharide/polyol phosphate transport system ATPase subunit
VNSAVSVRNVTKRFRIPMDRSTTLKYRMTHPISTARYRELLAVDDVSFEVPEGQFLGIIGSNGSGKSTLLKILAGIYRATSGSVALKGRARCSRSWRASTGRPRARSRSRARCRPSWSWASASIQS